ncbi:MAG: hypothetical protein IK005_07735 [Paludibacteraceae bacterium]|nr:hypothetical protein [Paludibacteraceae bacterium]
MKKMIYSQIALLMAVCGMECAAQTVSGNVDGYDYVDLGLPGGTLWATYNVGATKPTEYGDYFSWGEIKPKSNYGWDKYKWGHDWDSHIKYCTDSYYGTVDNKTVLDAEDDAATVNWSNAWRMPTIDEIQELIDGCSWTFEIDFNGSGIGGQVGTSKQNGVTIFLPAAGYHDGRNFFSGGHYCCFWSSSLNEEYQTDAYVFRFLDDSVDWYSLYRFYGYCVRAVVSKGNTGISNISNQNLQVYTRNGILYIANAQPNANIQVFDMNGKLVKMVATDGCGNANITLHSKESYVVTVDNQSTKVVIK